MKRQIPGLSNDSDHNSDLPEGVFLVRVLQAIYRYRKLKPFYTIRFAIVEPQEFANREFSSRLYCSERALWKLNWFLKDFDYDSEMLNRDELDDRALKGLRGVVKISRPAYNGHSYVSLDGFAPAAEWEELAQASPPDRGAQEAQP